jgi:hypothetical protein
MHSPLILVTGLLVRDGALRRQIGKQDFRKVLNMRNTGVEILGIVNATR